MDAVLSVAEGHLESEDYYLDLDADTGVEDFDSKLDSAYDNEAQQPPTEAGPDDSGEPSADFEIGYEDDEAHGGPSDSVYAEDYEKAGKDTVPDTGIDYQDEIGYDDEESSAADAAADQETRGTGTPSVGKSEGISEEHEGHRESSNVGAPLLETMLDPQADHDSNLEEPSGEPSPQDGFGDHQDQDMSGLNDAAGADVETTDESAQDSHVSNGITPASGLDDFDESADVSGTPSTVPGITVHYNQGEYALIGAPTDDPDSFFFSNEKDLDGSLTQFLASIRVVISDEVTAEDELTIRIDALNLEFGEKSNQRFLDRTFREVITCYSALATNSSKPVPYDPHNLELELLVRRDCEARFLELLEEAGIAGELSHLPDNPDGFEGEEEDNLSAQDEGGGALYEEQVVEDYSESYNSNDDVDIHGQDNTSQAATGNDEEVETEEAHEDGKEPEETYGSAVQQHGNGPHSFLTPKPDTEALYQEGHQGEEEEYAVTDNVESGEGYVDEDIDIAGGFSGQLEDESAFDQDKDTATLDFGIAEQQIQDEDGQQWDDEADEQAGFGFGEHLTDGDGTPLPESISDEVDINLTPDGDAAQATAREHIGAGNSILDIVGAQGDGLQQLLANGAEKIGMDDLVDSIMLNEGVSVDAQKTKSKHTSRTSTVNGDEIRFEENILADDFLAPNDEPDQLVDTPAAANDEIDWENDGDELDQKTTLTPSSTSGKRGRTNDLESLTDEVDYKRRRT